MCHRMGLSNLKVGTATSLGERLAELIASHDTSPAEELDVVFATLTDFTDHEMLANDQILLVLN